MSENKSSFRDQIRAEAKDIINQKRQALWTKQSKERDEFLRNFDDQTGRMTKDAASSGSSGHFVTCLIAGPIIVGIICLIFAHCLDFSAVLVGLVLGGIVGACTSKDSGKKSGTDTQKQRREQRTNELNALNQKFRQQQDLLDAEEKQLAEKMLKEYEAKVSRYAQQLMMQETKLQGVLQWQIKMMEKAIARVPKGNGMKVLDASLAYEVTNTKIVYYTYSDTHTSASEDCIFSAYGLPDLTADDQKEGFAQAITKLTMLYITQSKKANTVKMKVGHQDARVKLAYRELLF